MADKETTETAEEKAGAPDDQADTPEVPSEDQASSAATKPLPASVERALAKARKASRGERDTASGRWLAAIPLTIGVVLLALMLPRGTPPDGIPLPRVDRRVLAKIAERDDAMVAAATETRLPGDVLSVGTALRELNVAEASDDQSPMYAARARLDDILATAVRQKDAEEHLLQLRATQTRTFLDALGQWESGKEPEDFIASGGAFVRRAREAGWVQDRHILLGDAERRVAFKTVWNALTHLDRGAFALTLDEERAIYAFYIQHPRVPESSRAQLEDRLSTAKTPEACARIRGEYRIAEANWQAEKIKRLAMMDPSYPAHYALGVVFFKSGRNDLAADAFSAFLENHPEGPYALRARNHYKAALAAMAP